MALSMIRKLLRPYYAALVSVLARVLPKKIMLDKRYFEVWQKRGYHVTPVHFYEPVPDTACLPGSLWEGPGRMPGVDMRENGQLRLLESFAAEFRSEYDKFPLHGATAGVPFWVENASFTSVDVEMLYCMVRRFKPRRVIEIGSGFSTLILSHAIRVNASESQGPPCSYVVIDPYPWHAFLASCDNITSFMKLPVQQAPLTMFEELEEGDILFIDSSHVSKVGSDVNYELLEIVPSLKPGVLVHFHDIFFPFEYPKEWIMEKKLFWNEQYLLQAFLSHNSAFEVQWCGSYMKWAHSAKLEAAFGSYRPEGSAPASLWMLRVEGPERPSRPAPQGL